MDGKKLILAVFGTIIRVAAALIVIFVIYSAASTCYDYGYRIFTEPAVALGNGRDVTVTVTSDMSPLKIGELFEQEGLVRDDKLFALQYMFSEYRKEVQPGTFVLNTSMTAEDMMGVMADKGDKTVEDTQQTSLSGENTSIQADAPDSEENIAKIEE